MRALALLLMSTAVLVTGTAAHAEDNPGKAVFLSSSCNQCHAIAAQGIKSDGDAPDLSKVGATFDAASIEQILLKQKDIDGKKHKKKFQGSADDLKKLASWLASLK